MKGDTLNDSYFSTTYAEARRRFADAACTVGANVHSYKVDSAPPDDLAIDVAVLGSDNAPALVVSSGVHGIEGFFGSAIQLALLERLNDANPGKNIRYVLIHGMNPFGFSHLRRFNEDNVDLNRNFLINADNYAGVPDGYDTRVNRFLNPQSPPARLEPFILKVLWHCRRKRRQKLEQAVVVGQYEHSRGLFFGGKGPCKSTQIVQDNCNFWLAASQQIMHIDFHTGLGRSASHKLLLTQSSNPGHHAWYTDAFGAKCVEPLAQPGDTSYGLSGTIDGWMESHFCGRDYRSVCAEFGTYNPIRILGALRAENRAHHYCRRSSSSYLKAKERLLECFCPRLPSWRRQAINSGLAIIDQGIQALSISDGIPGWSASAPATTQAESLGRYVSDLEGTPRHAASEPVKRKSTD